MNFKLSGKEPFEFEIKDKWWLEADMHNFTRLGNSYKSLENKSLKIIPIKDIQPRRRTKPVGYKGFVKQRMLYILKGFRNNESIPPIEVIKIDNSDYLYELHDGFHRFYASVAAEYTEIPAIIREWI